MAQIYRGVQRSLGRTVAVKVMLPSIARDRENVQRFRREARTLAALHHENIVAVHDLVEKNGQIFMVLEHVAGVDVQELLAGGRPLPLDVSLIIATAVTRALEHAHFRRIIHRDIKPSNVMVSRRGEVKLADFGIAKDLTEADLTNTGFVVGTPSYLAPELLKGQRADHRADLYAVGVLLFQCLTGKKPYASKDSRELFAAILAGRRERLRALAPDCPRAVERIVDRCLESDVDARYARAADLRKDLEVQLHAAFSGNSAARLVAYLYSRGHASTDDLATLDLGELASADPSLDLSSVELTATRLHASSSIEIDVDETPADDSGGAAATPVRRARGISRALAALLALVLAAGAVAYALAPVETAAVVRRVFEQATGFVGL